MATINVHSPELVKRIEELRTGDEVDFNAELRAAHPCRFEVCPPPGTAPPVPVTHDTIATAQSADTLKSNLRVESKYALSDGPREASSEARSFDLSTGPHRPSVECAPAHGPEAEPDRERCN